jgi:sugar phosphate isomerase/epimerase
MYSRRQFARLALAAAPLSLARGESFGAVQIGVTTFSFRDLPRTGGRDRTGRILDALRAVGANLAELHSADTEAPEPISGMPKPQTGGAYGGMTVTLTPAELADIKLANRNNLRRWRMDTQPAVYEAIRNRFDAAGIALHAYRVDYDDEFTDDEIAVTFAQARALGVSLISTVTNRGMARRLAPFAEKNRMNVTFHNAGSLASADALRGALALSKNFRVNLDLGNFTAANEQALAYVQENHAAISHVTVKDRTRDQGANEEFGNGDTPIKPVLKLLREKQYALPALVEYEYLGVGTPEEEVKRCLAYVRQSLA